jgi:hypothetical protein
VLDFGINENGVFEILRPVLVPNKQWDLRSEWERENRRLKRSKISHSQVYTSIETVSFLFVVRGELARCFDH